MWSLKDVEYHWVFLEKILKGLYELAAAPWGASAHSLGNAGLMYLILGMAF